MKYLNTPIALSNELNRLMRDYNEYYWMVAWAGKNFPHSEALAQNTGKIRKLVVGLHYFHTHPSFIETFNAHPHVAFIKNESEVFLHSKVYLFTNGSENWELLLGSANFTYSAFHSNNEAAILIRSDGNNRQLYQEVVRSIDEAWNRGEKFTDKEFEDYKSFAKNRASEDGPTPRRRTNGRQRVVTPGQGMSWQQYISLIFEKGGGSISERIRLLDIVQESFRNYPVFATMPDQMRKQVGGFVRKGREVNFLLFGNMLNATDFTHLINIDPGSISHALDAIPLEGLIERHHFDTFASRFDEALGGGNKYRSASRLLAMKRPDIFFAISTGNNTGFAAAFGVPAITTINLGRYWQDVVLRIQASDWWRNPSPVNEVERSIYKYRAAFLDVLYYRPS